jgi:uncharacterized protein YggE
MLFWYDPLMNESSPAPSPAPIDQSALKLSLSWRTLVFLLIAVIAVMTYFWKPWEKTAAVRSITVQGQATVSAVPDTYVFQPVFEAADVKTVTVTGNDAVAQLKKLGAKDADIKTTISASPEPKPMPLSASGPNIAVGEPYPMPYPTSTSSTYLISVTVKDKSLAQKIADYLATTKATGQVTPMAEFSKDAQTKLDLTVRGKASDDAKAKAEVTAKQLSAGVGKVIKISDIGLPGIYSTESSGGVALPQPSKAGNGPVIQPGTNEVSYTFTVEFELK